MSIWDAPIELANKIYTLAYIASIVGAATILISTMSLFWSSAVRDKYADRQILEAQALGEQAKADAARAEERAGQANERASGLEVRAAGLEKETAEVRERTASLMRDTEAAKAEAEKARAAQARFESQFKWRVIPDTNRLVSLLSAKPDTVRIAFIAADPEATFLAIQFEKAFQRANWNVSINANTYGGAVFFGIFVPDSETDATKQIRSAFSDLGIGFATQAPPQPTMSFGSGGAPTLSIGSKPMPDIVNLIQSIK